MKHLMAWLIFTPVLLHGQYHIDRSSIAGGAGRSTGDVYAVSGTIGQTSVGTVTGGSYSSKTGFWNLIDIVETPAGPRLTIERTNGAVRVSWPLAAGNGVLEETDTLDVSPVPWRVASYPFVTNGSHIFVTIPLPDKVPVVQARNGEVINLPAKKVVRFTRR